MGVPKIKYFVSKDNYSYYKVNYEYKRITRISNNKMTRPDFDDLEYITAEYGLTKLRKERWIEVENTYYRSTQFEWVYKGVNYKTSDLPYPENILNSNPCDGKGYPDLVFHNGQIWETGVYGNYYPRLPMSRIDAQGKRVYKWTHVKNVRNFERT